MVTRSPNSWPPPRPTTHPTTRPGYAASAAGCIVVFGLAAMSLLGTLGAIVLIRWLL